MKFYETHYEEYINAIEEYNLHPEFDDFIKSIPNQISQFGNMIIYGPSGVGKYSLMLNMIKKYSPSELKYDKKMTLQTEKHQYIYRISDIHYEIDMSLLGCNSKVLWHDIFLQIVDIVSVKTEKTGIIVCKGFQGIHNELLEIFYSYIQQYNHPQLNFQIKFILITEQISFLPNNILNTCYSIHVKRPDKSKYLEMVSGKTTRRFAPINVYAQSPLQKFQQKISYPKIKQAENREQIEKFMEEMVEANGILNAKEVRSFSLYADGTKDIPKDIFNTICNSIIKDMNDPSRLVIAEFRDTLYDILIYNLDAIECIWHVLFHFVEEERLSSEDLGLILEKVFPFLKHYNNNYRPIYHLESIFVYIITKLYQYPDVPKRAI